MNPFKGGDVVYCIRFGKCVVKESRNGLCRVEINDGQHSWKGWEELSFTPWPKANHERPIQDGWWVVALKEEVISDWPLIRRKSGEKMYDAHNVSAKSSTSYTFHKFLGDSWK